MKSIRTRMAAMLLAGGALLGTATVFTIPNAAAGQPAAAEPAGEPGAVAPDMGPHGGWHHHRGGPGRLYSKLGLSTEQQASMKAIWEAERPQMRSMHETMRANHLKLAQVKPDDPNYANVVAEVAQSNAALASKRTSEGAEIRTQMYALLTQPQKTQLATLEAQMATRQRAE